MIQFYVETMMNAVALAQEESIVHSTQTFTTKRFRRVFFNQSATLVAFRGMMEMTTPNGLFKFVLKS